MPELADLSYSHDACVAAVRDYITFLTDMYLDESVAMEPPPGGWPEMTPKLMQKLGKNEDVIALLRHLPYIRTTGDDPQVAPDTCLVDWRDHIGLLLNNDISDPHDTLAMTEGYCWTSYVPSQVVGLTNGREDSEIWLLDTQLGVIYWPECPGDFIEGTVWEERRVQDDPYEWAPEKEAEWRADNAWSIADFFEMLKYQFRELRFIPITSQDVTDVWINTRPDRDGLRPMVQDIYRKHGWPDLERYNKQECQRAIRAALEEHYPNYL
jgi:hypothetical protein